MTNEKIKETLISAGVKNLKIFGYPEVDSKNILTDAIYSAFFKSMLEDNIGQAGSQVDGVITELIKEIV